MTIILSIFLRYYVIKLNKEKSVAMCLYMNYMVQGKQHRRIETVKNKFNVQDSLSFSSSFFFNITHKKVIFCFVLF